MADDRPAAPSEDEALKDAWLAWMANEFEADLEVAFKSGWDAGVAFADSNVEG